MAAGYLTRTVPYIQVSNEMTKLFYDGFGQDEISAFEDNLRRILGNLTRFESGDAAGNPKESNFT